MDYGPIQNTGSGAIGGTPEIVFRSQKEVKWEYLFISILPTFSPNLRQDHFKQALSAIWKDLRRYEGVV